MRVLGLFVWTVLIVCGVSAQENQSSVEEQDNEVQDDSIMRVMYKVLLDCTRKADISVCLKVKAVNYLDRALTAKSALPLMEYISLARDLSSEEGRSLNNDVTIPLTEEELEDTLPRSLDEKNDRLDALMLDKIGALLKSRTLQLTFPSDLFEGRGKKDKYGGVMLAAGAAMAGMFLQLALGKVALIAGKALMVAKIALVLSAVIGLKKLVGGGGGDSHPQVVYAGDHGGGYGHRRSLDLDAADLAAQEMAYSAHVDKPSDSK